MNERERFVATLRFEKPDRIPFDPGAGRQSTRRRWQREGLPEGVSDIEGHVRRLLGIEPKGGAGDHAESVFLKRTDVGVDFRMIPHFEEKVLERRPAPAGSTGSGSLIVQDWKGNICEISDKFDPTYLRNAIDFVTRSWLKCPVESREDWERMKERYALNTPGRFPADLPERGRKLKERTYPSGVMFNGPFWQLREWLGFENLCVLFLDDPRFVRDTIGFWKEFISRILDRVFQHHVPDFVLVSEDMAYKEKPMIGPAMCREFLFDSWQAWGDQCRRAGVPIYEVDSDGHVGQLIPVWIEAGFNCNVPQEVAAGNDLPAYRRMYGTKMAYRGGVDKRKMAMGGKALQDEMERLRPAVAAGGVIPHCDHGIPSDVSWENYLEYCRLLAQMTGWL